MKFKFNSGNMALVCSNCGCILKTGSQLTDEEWKVLRGEVKDVGDKYCDECIINGITTNDSSDDMMGDLNNIKNILPHIKDNPEFQNELYKSLFKKIGK